MSRADNNGTSPCRFDLGVYMQLGATHENVKSVLKTQRIEQAKRESRVTSVGKTAMTGNEKCQRLRLGMVI